jgi:DNA-binding protein HU-beta
MRHGLSAVWGFTMNKSDLISAVAEEASVTKAVATATVDALFGTIKGALAKQTSVSISGFGTFDVKEQAARDGRNPRTGDVIKLDKVNLAKFRPSQKLKDAVRG